MVTTKRQSSSFSEASYSEEVDTGALACQLSILEGMIRRRRYHACFDEILLEVWKFPEKKLIQEVQTICKPLAVNPATSVLESASLFNLKEKKSFEG